LEAEKRETLEALDRKNADYDRLQDEYKALHERTLEGRKEINRLESMVQQLQSTATSSKFKEQNLQNELTLLKQHNDWLDAEVKTKTQEYQKFRKEKAAQVSQLQRDIEEALQEVASEKKTSEATKERLDEVSTKLEQTIHKVQELNEQAIHREEAFRQEMNTAERLARLYKEASESAKARIDELDRQLGEEHRKISIEAGKAQAERREREAAEHKITELEVTIERLEADISTLASGVMNLPATPRGNGSQTPVRQPPQSALGTSLFSPAAARLQKAGISVTQIYSDYNAVKAELEAERRRSEKLQLHLDEIIQDLEAKVPEMEEQRLEYERLQAELIHMSESIEQISREKDDAVKYGQKQLARIKDFERETITLRKSKCLHQLELINGG
jgi:nucleoprotein TPR